MITLLVTSGSAQGASQSSLQAGIIPFETVALAPEIPSLPLEAALSQGLQASGVEVLPSALVGAPLSARNGSAINFNPHREEARQLGAALGCDFYLQGRVLSARRLTSTNESYFEVRFSLFCIDARTGTLVTWRELKAQGPFPEHARAEAICETSRLATVVVHDFQVFRKQQISQLNDSSGDTVLDLRSGEVPEDVTLPIFLKRPRPTTTEAARDASIEAKIETEIVFGTTGKVEDIRIVRWAGYGLDEAVIQAIQSYSFKPATQNGVPVRIKLLAEFNFRRQEKP
ncbi:MAG: TonB family protein [Acidobacteria bacterium]|nr:TonB family protein [Acidobacteriota bacterium]